MKLTTPVSLPEAAPQLSLSSHVLLMGSCFAEGVGQRLKDCLPEGHVMSNPFGVLYNPASIASALGCMLDGKLPTDEMLFAGRDGLWHSWLHDGRFSAADKGACAEMIERQFVAACDVFDKADLLCVTWGTSRLYRPLQSRLVAANCHKMPAATFQTADAAPEEIVGDYMPLLRALCVRRPGLRVVLTVSPYRYLKYGLHGSALTKARLLLAADVLEQAHDAVCYFPAYEIVTDELRDYRFYAADMVHPSEVAADYVFERFKTWCFDSELQAFAHDKAALLRDHRHRPLHSDSPLYAEFVAGMAQRTADFCTYWQNRGLNTDETGIMA